jgi:hypothetical protein
MSLLCTFGTDSVWGILTFSLKMFDDGAGISLVPVSNCHEKTLASHIYIASGNYKPNSVNASVTEVLMLTT